MLRNLAGLQDVDVLADHEAQASTLRLAQLAALRLEGAYDLAHLQGFHRFIFHDIYSWAGELRSVSLAKPGSMFALPEHIEGYTTKVLRQLNDEQHLHDLSRDEFAERLTHYYAEINAVHPFRRGQRARTARLPAPARSGRRPHARLGALGVQGVGARVAAQPPGRQPPDARPD